MEFSGERFLPRIEDTLLSRFDPFIAYEHWHRYRYAEPIVGGKVILDIASGEGYGSALLADHAALVYGVDCSPEAIEHARLRYVRDNLHFLQGSAGRIPIAGEHRFDVVVSFETIEHLDAPTQEQFALEIKRLLKPDGVLLISTPNRSIYSEARDHKNEYHINEHSLDEFFRFLTKYFKYVKLLSQHVFPVSYIWNLDGDHGPLAEYQTTFADGAFRPASGDAKEAVYLIAVCSNCEEPAAAPDSLLVDLSEVAFHGISGRERWQASTVYFDTGAGFRAEDVHLKEIEYGPDFSVRFLLDPAVPVRQLRWDPLERRLCRVRLRQILWEDGAGVVSRVDLGRVTSNGLQQGEATFQFETLDPMVFLPISGSVASIVIEGECAALDEHETLNGLEHVASTRLQRLTGLGHELRVAHERLAASESALLTCRHQLARQEEDLGAAAEQLALRQQALAALTEALQKSERWIVLQQQQIEILERERAQLRTMIEAIVHSKRWVAVNWVRAALYLVPRLLRRSFRRVVAANY